MIQRRMLLADDNALFREALLAAVSRVRPDFLVEQAESLEAARAALLRDPEVDLLLLDLKLPDCKGLVGIATLRAEFPHAPVVVVSASVDATTISDVIATGALGFIPKSASISVMSQALAAVLEGDVWTP